MSDLNLNFIIRGRDLGLTSTVGKAVGSTAALGRSVAGTVAPTKAMTAATDRAGAATAKADQAAKKDERSLGALFRAIGRVVPSQTRLSAAAGEAARDLDRQARSTEKAEAPTKRFTTALGGLFRALKTVSGMPGVGDKQEKSLERAREKARRFGADLGRAVGGAITAGSLAFVALGGSVIATGAKFEQFETVLTTLEGTSAKARDSMAWVTKFAATTPYEIDQTMEAFVKLKAYGIDPINGTLRTLGNASSAMGKDLMASVEMIADAQTGEFERLKEFGIRASQAGNTVKLTYVQAGKDITVTTTKNAAAIRKAVLGIFDTKFKGAMEAQSKTFNGMMSTMKDGWTNFQKAIADAGVFKLVKTELDELMAKMNAASADGSLQRWAGEISASLVELFRALKGAVTSIDWPKFISGVADAITNITNFIDWCGGLVTAMGGLNNVVTTVGTVGLVALGVGLATSVVGFVSATGAALGLDAALAPILPIIWAVIAVIGVFAGAAFLIWRNWGPISAWFKGMWAGLTTWLSAKLAKWGEFFSNMWAKAKAAFAQGVAAVWSVLPPWLKLALKGIGLSVKLGVNFVKGLIDDKNAQKAPPRVAPRIVSDLPGTPRAQADYVRNRAQEAQAQTSVRPAPPKPVARFAPPAPTIARPMAPARPTILGANGTAGATKPQPLTGRIEIAVSQDGPPRVRSVRTNQPDLALSLARGPVGAGG